MCKFLTVLVICQMVVLIVPWHWLTITLLFILNLYSYSPLKFQWTIKTFFLYEEKVWMNNSCAAWILIIRLEWFNWNCCVAYEEINLKSFNKMLNWVLWLVTCNKIVFCVGGVKSTHHSNQNELSDSDYRQRCRNDKQHLRFLHHAESWMYLL